MEILDRTTDVVSAVIGGASASAGVISEFVSQATTWLYSGAMMLAITVPDVNPEWNAPGVNAVKYVAGWAMALATTALIVGFIVSVVALVASKALSSNQRTLAITGVIICFFGAALLGSATALLNAGGQIQLV